MYFTFFHCLDRPFSNWKCRVRGARIERGTTSRSSQHPLCWSISFPPRSRPSCAGPVRLSASCISSWQSLSLSLSLSPFLPFSLARSFFSFSDWLIPPSSRGFPPSSHLLPSSVHEREQLQRVDFTVDRHLLRRPMASYFSARSFSSEEFASSGDVPRT